MTSNANTSGLEVVAWRWETPIPHVGDGTKWGWSFASHWSTPPSSLNHEPLVTAASAQTEIQRLTAALANANAGFEEHERKWYLEQDRATAAEARADRLAEIARLLNECIWFNPDTQNFEVNHDGSVEKARAALQQEG